MLARIRKAAEEREGGFTLIELLVVIIIIGILAAIAIPVFLNQRQKGYDAQAKADLRNLATAEETYLTGHPAGYESAPADASTDANLIAAGFKKSSNVAIAVEIDGTNGFCEAATSSSGNTWWYDSQDGGLQPAASSTAPATKTCGVAANAPTVPPTP